MTSLQLYQLIAKNHLSHWLETLLAQIAARQREQQHGLFKTVVERGRIFTGNYASAADLLHSVTAEAKRRSAAVS